MSESIKTVSEGGAAQQVNVERLLEPARLGPYDLPSRLVMAPLTRSRARQPGNVPFSLNACYYEQRASAALIISEATQVSQQGQGHAWTEFTVWSKLKDGNWLPPRCTKLMA
jgi:N-ethylmaleimide reductase